MGKKPNLESLLKINWREEINQFRPLLASGSPFHKLYIYERLEGHGGKMCPTSRATSNSNQEQILVTANIPFLNLTQTLNTYLRCKNCIEGG